MDEVKDEQKLDDAGLVWRELPFVEPQRTYVFPEGRVAFHNVLRICVRPSGSHRLELNDGRKVIVRAGWLAIELVDCDEWSF